MVDNRNENSEDLYSSIKPGMVVIDSSDARLGTVKQVEAEEFFLDREAGFDLHIPFAAVQEVDEEFVKLRVKRDELATSGLGSYPYDVHPEPDEAPRPGDIKL